MMFLEYAVFFPLGSFLCEGEHSSYPSLIQVIFEAAT